MSEDIFKDRRRLDRRRHAVDCLVPHGRCRRRTDRRRKRNEFSLKPWWLAADYSPKDKPLPPRSLVKDRIVRKR